jgi:hypothetical protein
MLFLAAGTLKVIFLPYKYQTIKWAIIFKRFVILIQVRISQEKGHLA